MSDIDFDELDRAVNGALGSNDTPEPVSSTDDTQTSDEPATITRVERTQLSPVSHQTTPVSTPAAVAPAARRSSGRFMDMVHPSSDMRSQDRGAAVTSKPVVTPEVTTEESTPDYVETPAWNEPLESPFLPDAKVEKRPLGGGEATDKTGITDAFDFQGLLDEPEEELLEAPEPQERIEATALPDPIDFAAASAVNDDIEATSFEPEEPVKEEPVVVEEAPTEPEAVVEAPQPIVEAPQPIVEEPIGPTSITPQYKEQPSSNQESGAMYDTESYHQAVTAPVKKKSGWFTVLWIVLLVIFGAGAGWAVYTYVLPML